MADNRKYYYLKLKEDFFDTDEMKILESMKDGYLYSNILLKLYLKSLSNSGRLMYRNVIPYTPEILATLTGHQVGTVEKALDVFKKLDLIEMLDNGAIYMMDIQNFIGQSSSEADRQREYYNRMKAEKEALAGESTETPELPEPKEPVPPAEQKSNKAIGNYTTDFEELWEAYPRKVDKGQAYKKYKARLEDGFSHEQLWDSSRKIYRYVKGSQPLKTPKLHWTFKRGASVNFAHLGRDEDCDDWQGSQLTMIGFDELTHFSEYQFFYMLSRNRTDSGVKPYVRATCNPDADSWVAEFISWWINQETGYPIPERSGVIRWMVRLNEVVTWFDSREEAVQGAIENGVKPEQAETMPKSVTFIATGIEQIKADFTEAVRAVYAQAKTEGVLRYNDVRPLISAIAGVEDFETFTMNGKMQNITLKSEEYPDTGTLNFS